MVGGKIVHDLIDHDVIVARGIVGSIPRRCFRGEPITGSRGKCLHRVPADRPGHPGGCQHVFSAVDEKQRNLIRTDRHYEGNAPTVVISGRHRSTQWHLVGKIRQRRQEERADVDRALAGIVKLDPIEIVQPLCELHLAECQCRCEPGEFAVPHSGRASVHGTHPPVAPVVNETIFIQHHKAVPRSVRRDGPVAVIAVIHGTYDDPILVLESDPLASVVESSDPGTKDFHTPRYARVGRAQGGLIDGCDQNPLEGMQKHVLRSGRGEPGELVVHSIREFPFREVERGRGEVLHFNIFRQRTRRVIHDLAEDDLFGLQGQNRNQDKRQRGGGFERIHGRGCAGANRVGHSQYRGGEMTQLQGSLSDSNPRNDESPRSHAKA